MIVKKRIIYNRINYVVLETKDGDVVDWLPKFGTVFVVVIVGTLTFVCI